MRHIYYAPILFFVALLVFLISFELYQGQQNYQVVMENKAQEIVNTVITYRKWAAGVNNLYADAEKVTPNPYLGWRKDRDKYIDGLHLTLVNPSYMTRLVSEEFKKKNGIQIKMVGVNPVNPANSAIEWEKSGLQEFKTGADSYIKPSGRLIKSLTFHYMSPLYIEKPCLACHERQGFKEGDLIGALSVTLPKNKTADILWANTVRNIVAYLVISIILMVTVAILQKKIFLLTKEQEKTINSLNREIKKREMSEKALVRQTRIASQGELLSLVAHHWRQPLNAVSLTLDTLRCYISQQNDPNHEAANDINMSQQLIQELSQSIDVFKNNFSEEKDNTEFGITDSVVATVETMRPVLEQLHIKVWLQCIDGSGIENICICSTEKRQADKCPFDEYVLRGSRNEFNQILLAMLKNSYEAILEQRHKGSDDRQGVVTVAVAITDSILTVSVTDNGAGVSDDAAEQIFDPFFTTKGYDYGRGTGLYFAKLLAQKFPNGNITYNKNADDTEFIFSTEIG